MTLIARWINLYVLGSAARSAELILTVQKITVMYFESERSETRL